MRISDWSSDVCSSALLAGGAVAVVGQRIDDHGDAAGAIALVEHLFVIVGTVAAGAALDGALDGILRHVGGAGGRSRGTQARIGRRGGAAAQEKRGAVTGVARP